MPRDSAISAASPELLDSLNSCFQIVLRVPSVVLDRCDATSRTGTLKSHCCAHLKSHCCSNLKTTFRARALLISRFPRNHNRRAADRKPKVFSASGPRAPAKLCLEEILVRIEAVRRQIAAQLSVQVADTAENSAGISEMGITIGAF